MLPGKASVSNAICKSVVTGQVLVMLCLDAGRKTHSTSKWTVKDMEVEVSRWHVGARDETEIEKKVKNPKKRLVFMEFEQYFMHVFDIVKSIVVLHVF